MRLLPRTQLAKSTTQKKDYVATVSQGYRSFLFSIMFFFIDKSGKTGGRDFLAYRRLIHALEGRIFFSLPRYSLFDLLHSDS